MKKTGFVFLNLILSSNIVGYLLMLLIGILYDKPIPFWRTFLKPNSFAEILFVVLFPLFIFLSYWLLKIFIFIFIDKISIHKSFIFDFWSRYCNDKNFKKRVILIALIMDIISLLLWDLIISNGDTSLVARNLLVALFLWGYSGAGVLISYFSYDLYKKIKS